jgi:hypothetical protein
MIEENLNNIPESNDELTNAEKREIKQEVKENIKKEEKLKNDNEGIQPELTKEEKVRTFFDGIEFL